MRGRHLIGLLLALAVLCCGCGRNTGPTGRVELPGQNQNKLPSQYTWEEYLAMDESQRLEFQKSFGSPEIFEAWKEKAQRGEIVESLPQEETTEPIDVPWDEVGAKLPWDYTWAEFLDLPGDQQILFQHSFESEEAFEAWMDAAIAAESTWQGEKDPWEYTWEEFQALSGNEQILFQQSFESTQAFEDWMEQAMNPEDSTWQGEKDPWDYTWEEFLALSGEEQIHFQQSFDTPEDFEAWMNQAMNADD